MKKRIILISACLLGAALVIAAAVFTVSAVKKNTPVEFEYTVPEYDRDFWGDDFKSAFSKYGNRFEPEKVYVSSSDEPEINEIPTDPIDVYRYRHSYYLKYVYGEEHLYDFEELKQFSERIIPSLISVLNVKDGAAEEKHEPSRNRITVDIEKYSIDIEQYPFYQQVELRKAARYASVKPIIVMNDSRLGINPALTDAEIIESLEMHKETLFQVFGCTFEDVKLVRRYGTVENAKDYITVYYYTESDSALNQYAPVRSDATFEEHDSIGFYSDYISVVFPFDNGSKNAVASVVKYTRLRVPSEDIFPKAYTADMISLKAAEEMLYNDCFFSRNVCVLCAGEKINVTEYDYVSFEYLAGDGFRNDFYTYVMPFYVFYVKEEDGEKYDVYSKYYVPAIRFKNGKDYWTYPNDNYYKAHKQHKTEESEEEVYG